MKLTFSLIIIVAYLNYLFIGNLGIFREYFLIIIDNVVTFYKDVGFKSFFENFFMGLYIQRFTY